MSSPPGSVVIVVNVVSGVIPKIIDVYCLRVTIYTTLTTKASIRREAQSVGLSRVGHGSRDEPFKQWRI
jgi:hypothetical protein